MRRQFNLSERTAIYLRADGKCQACGAELGPGWHADHIVPFSRGGETIVENGQALCPACNLSKGDKMAFDYRPFQSEFLRVMRNKIDHQGHTIFADIHPGSGKTHMALAGLNEAFRHDYIDGVLIAVPRLNLAKQFEDDWAEFREFIPGGAVMPNLNQADNNPPLFLERAAGYVTTYQALTSNPFLHMRELRGRRYALVCDEAHQLGVDWASNAEGMSKKSAETIEELAHQAKMIVLMTGTKNRSDGLPIVFLEENDYYSPPDNNGVRYAKPDVSALYKHGVAQRYLRTFECVFHDGIVTVESLGDEPENIQLSDSDYEYSIREAVQRDEYWRPMIDKFMEHFIERRSLIDPRICGLIAADRQDHARKIQRYLKQQYPDMRVLIAVSEDGPKAKSNLQLCREGHCDVLVTVQMAYVGFDYKPITHVCILISFRTEVFLRQLVARGLRMWDDLGPEQQCFIFAPADTKMQNFIEVLRRERDEGLAQRQRLDRERESVTRQDPLHIIHENIWAGEFAKGLDPIGDANPSEYVRAEAARSKAKIPIGVTYLLAWQRYLEDENEPPPTKSIHAPHISDRQRLFKYRREIKKIANSIDREAGWDHEAYKRQTGRKDSFSPTYRLIYEREGIGNIGDVDDDQWARDILEYLQKNRQEIITTIRGRWHYWTPK